ncbi:MAG: hypothetical protein P8N02_18800 [Actinomycetota bacterium]|nr:hypothetical protein [Actinomycetota bacterium]
MNEAGEIIVVGIAPYFGDAGFFGSMGDLVLKEPIVDTAPTPEGRGYWKRVGMVVDSLAGPVRIDGLR